MPGAEVESSSEGEGKGSTFTVTLPTAEYRSESGVEMSAPLENQIAIKRRILVVDDNTDGANSLALMLRLMNNDVCIAHDGIQAIEKAEAFQPDLILMDVGMPKLNGLDATRGIRAKPWGKHMKIIALTGWGQDGDKKESREAGCDGHLVKPVNLPDLEKLLEERCNTAKARW